MVDPQIRDPRTHKMIPNPDYQKMKALAKKAEEIIQSDDFLKTLDTEILHNLLSEVNKLPHPCDSVIVLIKGLIKYAS